MILTSLLRNETKQPKIIPPTIMKMQRKEHFKETQKNKKSLINNNNHSFNFISFALKHITWSLHRLTPSHSTLSFLTY